MYRNIWISEVKPEPVSSMTEDQANQSLALESRKNILAVGAGVVKAGLGVAGRPVICSVRSLTTRPAQHIDHFALSPSGLFGGEFVRCLMRNMHVHVQVSGVVHRPRPVAYNRCHRPSHQARRCFQKWIRGEQPKRRLVCSFGSLVQSHCH
jgi:hypothetical protein